VFQRRRSHTPGALDRLRLLRENLGKVILRALIQRRKNLLAATDMSSRMMLRLGSQPLLRRA
jgi:hypothetical protein